MDATSEETEESHNTLSPEEEIHCHKARIFSVLTKVPVVRAWKDAVCDGAVYLGNLHSTFRMSYADRYFVMSREDISYVTFSIVTAFKESGPNADRQGIEQSQCHISQAQREASEFLIVTFSDDRDRVALVPHREYWPVEGEENTGKEEAFPDEITASILSKYSFPIFLLSVNIEELRRKAIAPMHPSTTPIQIGLDGRIPKAGTPDAIMPQASAQQIEESDQSIPTPSQQEEAGLRIIHDKIPKSIPAMRVDFLAYQPMLRDFRILISEDKNSEDKKFPNGLEVVINHKVCDFTFPKTGSSLDKCSKFTFQMGYADYLFIHTLEDEKDIALFVPRKFIAIDQSTSMSDLSQMLHDLGQKHKHESFGFKMDKAGRWVQNVWKTICEHPPDQHPTPAEKKQEIWKNALPWPETEAQVAILKESTPQKARRDKSKHDSGTGEGDAVKPSDVSLLADHYLEKASLADPEGGNDDT